MKKLDGARIETALALLVLGAVIALFLKFYRPASEAPVVTTPEISAPAAESPTHTQAP